MEKLESRKIFYLFLLEVNFQLFDHLGLMNIVLLDEAAGSSEDFSGGEVEAQEDYQINEEPEVKEKLLQKYSGYISTLKHEFSKRKKKGKLPKEARQILLDWWNVHYKWPYPTVNMSLNYCL